MPSQSLSILLTTEKDIGMVIFTWLWIIVLLDWPFVFAHTRINNTINTITQSYKDFIYYYPHFPKDPIDAFFALGDVRDWVVAKWAVLTNPKYYQDAKQKRKTVAEFYALIVFVWILYFVYYMIFRFEGFNEDFWGEEQEVTPVHIPAHWLQR